MKKFVVAFVLFLSMGMAGAASAAPAPVKHTIKMAARPYKVIGHATRLGLGGVIKVATVVSNFSFTDFDATVIDPLGVAIQAFADGVDMFIAQPLESLPKPVNVVGEGIHYVYLGVDKVGQQLAK